MCIYRRQNVHIRKPKCAFTEAKMRIYGRDLLYMHILASVCAHLRKEKMRIYGRQNAHIRKRASVYVHFRFRICTFTEAKMCIYGRDIYGSQNVHIRKLSSVYAHFGFRICAFFPSINAHIRKLSSVYAHFVFRICEFTEESFHICTFWLLYMCIYKMRRY